MDAGFFLNTSCPAMLRPGRRLDLILSFDYSLSLPFEVPDPLPGQAKLLSSRTPEPLAQTSLVPKGRGVDRL